MLTAAVEEYDDRLELLLCSLGPDIESQAILASILVDRTAEIGDDLTKLLSREGVRFGGRWWSNRA